jgi:hypothetical protein
VLDESQMKLDYVLGLRTEDFLERRLQTQVRDRSLSGLHCTQQGRGMHVKGRISMCRLNPRGPEIAGYVQLRILLDHG